MKRTSKPFEPKAQFTLPTLYAVVQAFTGSLDSIYVIATYTDHASAEWHAEELRALDRRTEAASPPRESHAAIIKRTISVLTNTLGKINSASVKIVWTRCE